MDERIGFSHDGIEGWASGGQGASAGGQRALSGWSLGRKGLGVGGRARQKESEMKQCDSKFSSGSVLPGDFFGRAASGRAALGFCVRRPR